MQTTFLIQATYMKLKFDNYFTVPAASLSIFDIVAILTLIPIMDHVVYPLLNYCGIRFTPLRRIGVGMLLAAASVVVAGVIEIKRRNVWKDGGFHNQTVFNEPRNASSLGIFWQVPQFVLIGSSEVLTSITGTTILNSTFCIGGGEYPQNLWGDGCTCAAHFFKPSPVFRPKYAISPIQFQT